MSIKTTKRIVLAVISALVFAPFAVVAPASAIDQNVGVEVDSLTGVYADYEDTGDGEDLVLYSEEEVDASALRLGEEYFFGVNVSALTAINYFSGPPVPDTEDTTTTLIDQIYEDTTAGFEIVVTSKPGSSNMTVSDFELLDYTSEDTGVFSASRSAGDRKVTLDIYTEEYPIGYEFYSVDGAAYPTVGFGFTPDAYGSYTLSVRGLDAAGNPVGPVQTLSFTVPETMASIAATRDGSGTVFLDSQEEDIVIEIDGVVGVRDLVYDDEVGVKVTVSSPATSEIDAEVLAQGFQLNEDLFHSHTDYVTDEDAHLFGYIDEDEEAFEETTSGSTINFGSFSFMPDKVGTYALTFQLVHILDDVDEVPTYHTYGTARTVTIRVAETGETTLDAGAFEITNDLEAPIVGEDSVTFVDRNEEGSVNFVEFVDTPAERDDFDFSMTRNTVYNYAVTATSNLRFTISGPAVWNEDDDRAGDASSAKIDINSVRKVMTFSQATAGGLANITGHYNLGITGTGTITISVASVVKSTGAATAIGSYTIEVVNTPKAGVFSAADSFAQLQSTATTLSAIPTPPVDVAGAATRANGGTAYLAMYLRDVYDGPISETNMALIATATSGALVNWGAIPVAATSVLTSGLSTPILWIRQGTATSTTVEVKLNSTVVATKTVSWTGAASGIAISSKKVSVPVSASTAAFKYAISDAAGNRVASSATVTAVDGIYVTAATAAAGSATAASDVTVTCSALRGKGSVTLTYATTKTETVEVICAGGIASFEVTTSKAAFERSEIGVLTITAKDAAGNPVPDGTALASAAGKIQFTGAGASLAKSPAATDTFTDGKIDYAFTTSATAGSYNFALWHADLSPAVTKIAQFTVTAPAAAAASPTLTASLEGSRVLLFGACSADEGDMVIYVKSPGKPWQERAKTLECVAGEFEGSIKAAKTTKYYRVKQEGTGLWSASVLVRR